MRPILLTGATGFLGAYLCSELLRRTASEVICLVRADDTAHAATRIRQRMAALGRLDCSASRILPLVGDLAHDKLRLDESSYSELVNTVGAVYHCAADVNLASPYGDSRPVNVGGTSRLIELTETAAAVQRHRPHFHYVSTLGTFSRAREAGVAHVDESTIPTTAMAAELGYARGKTEAERCVRTAVAHGLPATIYRPGVITGDHTTGTSSASDVTVALMAAMLALGSAPLSRFAVYLDTVDTVAAGIVALSQRPNVSGKVFHHVRPDPLPVTDLVTALRARGHRLPTLPPQVWWQKVEQRAQDPRVLPAAVFGNLGGPILTELGDSPMPPVHSAATRRELRTAGVVEPPLDAAFLGRLVTASSVRVPEQPIDEK